MLPSCNADALTGTFIRQIFFSKDTGYCVFLYQERGQAAVTVVGNNLPAVHYPVTFHGQWVEDPNYGRQFRADLVVNQLPQSRNDIIAMIADLKIGIGKKRAEKLLACHSGTDFWQALEEHPEQFSRAISQKSLDLLRRKVRERTVAQALAQMFGTHLSLTTLRVKRIVEVFKENLGDAIPSIKENPYLLVRAGIPFAEIDKYAVQHLHISVNSPKRLLGAAQDALLAGQANCHVCIPSNDLLSRVQSALRVCGRIPADDCRTFLQSAIQDGSLCCYGENVYLPRAYHEEGTLAETLLTLNNRKDESVATAKIDTLLAAYQKKNGFSLSDEQASAVRTALIKSVCVITGSPGTGKSTILDCVRDCWKALFPKDGILLLAPTGRAAARMAECTNEAAYTIHSALRLEVDNPSIDEPSRCRETISGGLVIVDETSMVDLSTASALAGAMQACLLSRTRLHLVLVGDADQLPSVGYGNVLADVIASNTIPVCALRKIFRQAQGNPIITNSIKIRNGDADLGFAPAYPTFRGINNGNEQKNLDAACRFFTACVKQYGIENVVLLSPYHKKTAISTDCLNKKIQAMLFDDSAYRGAMLTSGNRKYHVGDRVIMQRNTETLSNGDIGTVIEIVPDPPDESPYLLANFEGGGIAKFARDGLTALDLAYAITIHKSQGSQYQTVIMMLPDNPSAFLRRNLIYTGITRAVKNVAIIGAPRTLQSAILNGTPEPRCTGLVARLQGN